jgi:hypothetical protein
VSIKNIQEYSKVYILEYVLNEIKGDSNIFKRQKFSIISIGHSHGSRNVQPLQSNWIRILDIDYVDNDGEESDAPWWLHTPALKATT